MSTDPTGSELPLRRVRPLATSFGAELSGLDLSGGWDDAVVAELRGALAAHKLLVIHGQAGLSAS